MTYRGTGCKLHLIDQHGRYRVGAIDLSRLGDLAGRLTPEEQWGLDAALLAVLGLS